MSKPKTIEKLKSVSLVVLFLSTVLLLYFFWGNHSYDQLKTPDIKAEEQIKMVEKVTKAMIKPEKIIVYFGGENYTVITDDMTIWKNDEKSSNGYSMVDQLDRFGRAESILVKEITYSEYQEIMRFDKSIRAKFAYDVPMDDFFSYFDIKKNQGYDVIGAVSEVGYSSAYPNSIFLFDGENSVYYRLYSDKDNTEFQSLIASIESKNYNIYYPMSKISGVKNDTLIPLLIESNLRDISYQQDAYVYQDDKISSIAEKFFGENFDFVRKITENDGTTIYMYGYGQEVLIANTDGSFEYKCERMDEGSEQSYSEALATAMDFIDSHGPWDSLKSVESAKMKPYLKDALKDPSKKKGYRFVFGIDINGSRLFYEKGNPITVEVTNGQVVYYKIDMIDFDEDDMEAIEAASYLETYSGVNLIAQNYDYIYGILLDKGIIKIPEAKPGIFEDVASLITDMQIGYVKTSLIKEEHIIKPAWIVTINNINIYFDLFNAEPLGFSAE